TSDPYSIETATSSRTHCTVKPQEMLVFIGFLRINPTADRCNVQNFLLCSRFFEGDQSAARRRACPGRGHGGGSDEPGDLRADGKASLVTVARGGRLRTRYTAIFCVTFEAQKPHFS